MKIKTILVVSFTVLFISNSVAQIQEYLASNSKDISENEISFEPTFYDNQIFMFGFIHGSATPQKIDFKLLKHLNRKGVKYYAPEVDVSLAYFLNIYLKNGDEQLLDYITYYYSLRVPQDASIEFMAKWREIYQLNKTLNQANKIKVLGFDKMIDKTLALTHLAHLAPKKESGISEIDSLKHFTNTTYSELHIKSGKPVWKSGKSWDYFFGGEKAELFNRLNKLFENDKEAFLVNFSDNAEMVKMIFELTQKKNREKTIYENFQKIATPLINKGEKIYCNYGYFHIQQKAINDKPSFASMIKKEGRYSLTTIQGLLIDSDCLKHTKLCSDKNIEIKGVTFKKMNYCGYETSTELDGHTSSEKVNGVEYLEELLSTNDIMLTSLVSKESPFFDKMMFADYSKGGKYWQVEDSSVTTDYFQYIITMKNSKANTHRLENK